MRVESQGYVDKKRGRTLYGRSRAYIRVNGRDYSLHRRGFNVVVISRRTGKFLLVRFLRDYSLSSVFLTFVLSTAALVSSQCTKSGMASTATCIFVFRRMISPCCGFHVVVFHSTLLNSQANYQWSI